MFSLFVGVDMAQEIATQIKGSWRFLNSLHLYINHHTSVTVLNISQSPGDLEYLLGNSNQSSQESLFKLPPVHWVVILQFVH